MDRLTKVMNCPDGAKIYDVSNELFKANCSRANKTRIILEKLAYYENLEEQNRLIKLPCKVGDTVYQLNVTAKNPIIPLRVVEYRFAIVGNHVREKICCSDDFLSKCCPNIIAIYYAEDIGDKVFLTKEEAETTIKRLKGMDIDDIERD